MTAFDEVLAEVAFLHAKKNADYGTDTDPYANVRASEDFGIPAWVGVAIRANDKMRRLMRFADKDVLVNESVEDSFMDLAVYAVLGLLLYREPGGKGTDGRGPVPPDPTKTATEQGYGPGRVIRLPHIRSPHDDESPRCC